MDFDTLVGGEYRLLLEPISFLKFQGTLIAVTATEAALYDEMLSGGLRAVLPTVAFQNLPLSMFLETPDLGYPAWGGPTSGIRSNSEIKSSLGLGIVRFRDVPPEEPEITTYDYEYRTNTEVITAVEVSGGQSDPGSSGIRNIFRRRKKLRGGRGILSVRRQSAGLDPLDNTGAASDYDDDRPCAGRRRNK